MSIYKGPACVAKVLVTNSVEGLKPCQSFFFGRVTLTGHTCLLRYNFGKLEVGLILC